MHDSRLGSRSANLKSAAAAPLGLMAVLLGAVLLPISAAGTDDSGRDPKFDQLMATTARTDPDAPAVLEAALQHVDSLLKAHEGHCETGLGEAQAAFDAASARPAVSLVLPLGAARLASLSYELHRAQAACTDDAAGQDAQRRLALAAAQQGVERYREALDYRSMAVMQFNIAATLRSLGEQDAAVAALATAIGMDHEYGLREDAHEHEGLMQQWRPGTPPAPEAAAPRSVSLQFGWRESDAQAKIDVSVAYLSQGSQGHASQASATKVVTQQVRQSHGKWRLLRDLSREASIDRHGFDGRDVLFGLVLPMTEALAGQPGIVLDGKGAFESPLGEDHLSRDLVQVGREMAAEAQGQNPGLLDRHRLYDAYLPQVIRAQSEETYNLETGAWIGATLEQGTWHRTIASLRLAGMTHWFLPQNVEFAYTRDVPCTPAAETPQCVEIVMHATPVPEVLDQFNVIQSGLGRAQQYWSSTCVRLVTEPKTLTPYRLEVRHYWHVSNREFSREPVSGMDRVVTTFTYRAPEAAGGPS